MDLPFYFLQQREGRISRSKLEPEEEDEVPRGHSVQRDNRGAYQQCLQEHYTDQHAKLHPEQAAARQAILEAAGQWRDYHPLADTRYSVDEDEWNSRAEAGHFPPCSQLEYVEGPQEQSTDVQEVRAHYSRVQNFRRIQARNRISFSTDGAVDNDTEPCSVTEAAPPQASAWSQDEVVLFVACLFLFLAYTWVFSSFTIFVTPMSTAAFTLSNSTTAVANWTPTASQCTLQSCFVLHSALAIFACGLVLTLCPSLIVTPLARLRIQVSTASTTYEHSVPAVRSLYDSQNATETDNIPVTPRRLHSRPAARSRDHGSSSNRLYK